MCTTTGQHIKWRLGGSVRMTTRTLSSGCIEAFPPGSSFEDSWQDSTEFWKGRLKSQKIMKWLVYLHL